MKEYQIAGMKCGSCLEKIDYALQKAGYPDAQVTLVPPAVKFVASAPTSNELHKILSEAGEYTALSPASVEDTLPSEHQENLSDERLTPLFIILTYIIGGVALRAILSGDYSFNSLMNNFMGGFFIVFSLFKLLNLSGFADAYATYDILAARSRSYGLAYPFIELILGIAYFTGFAPLATNAFTLALMLLGSAGVFQALRKKRKFQCACLGTALKLPMTKVTLVEDLTMGAMALLMLLY